METIENGFKQLDAHKAGAIQKHLEIFTKAIYDSANVSHTCAKNLDSEFLKHFPELDEMKCDDKPFNPTTVVEFRDGKAHQVIEVWDKQEGLLPNRIVQEEYHIDIGSEAYNKGETTKSSFYCNTHKREFKSFKCSNCGNQEKTDFSCNHQFSCFQLGCGCTMNDHNIQVNYMGDTTSAEGNLIVYCKQDRSISSLKFNNQSIVHNFQTNNSVPSNYCSSGQNASTYNHLHNGNNTVSLFRMTTSTPDIKRGIDKPIWYNRESHDFEVDNYLNLYHKPTGLYLMFNKTVFPRFPFYVKKQGKEVYTSKRISGFEKPEILTADFQKSKDNRGEFLIQVNQLIPDDIKEVYDFFNRFRNFKSFNHKGDTEVTSEIVDNSEEADPRDVTLNSYRIRLEETLKKLDSSDKIMSEMVEEYDRKSVEIKTKSLEIKQLEKMIEEIKAKHTLEIQESKSNEDMKSIEEIETLKTSNFRYQKRLLEIEKQKAEMDTMGISMETLKRENRVMEVKLERLSGMNEKLVSQIQSGKTKIREIETSQSLTSSRTLELENENSQKLSQIKTLKKELDDKTNECSKLTESLKQVGDKSSDALEMALSDKIETLTEEIKLVKQKNTELENKNSNSSSQLNRLKSTLSGLIN